MLVIYYYNIITRLHWFAAVRLWPTWPINMARMILSTQKIQKNESWLIKDYISTWELCINRSPIIT